MVEKAIRELEIFKKALTRSDLVRISEKMGVKMAEM
jgi:hypothetical protein